MFNLFLIICIQKIKIMQRLDIIGLTVSACCDFIAQFILVRTTGNAYHLLFLYSFDSSKIYRCWIIWGSRIRVVIVPSFLAFAFLGPSVYLHSPTDLNLWFLAIWIAQGTAPLFIIQGQLYSVEWSGTLGVTGLALSMTVNALVTGLIVFKILKVFRQVKTHSADDQILGVTGGSTLQRVIFILIESGMALFSIQLTRLVVIIVTMVAPNNEAAYAAYYVVIGTHKMFNVIIRSVIVILFY